ncbi:hypothetical protein GIW70_15285 [Pseudomonas syringae]|nr:hypothetical protein [Pseudomonas syringae]MCF5069552.1 hypothetical protein [Pseudomonas syringae]
MKTTTAIFATMLTVGSASVFAEGGAERMHYHWDNFPVETVRAQHQAEANSKEIYVPGDQTAQVTESYRR